MRLQKLGRILAAEGELQPLITKARDLRALSGLVQVFFPEDLARQVRVANYKEGELVLTAASAAAGAKLRLLAPTLSHFLSQHRWQVNSVSVRVQPNASQTRGGSQKTATFSTHTINSLRALHDRMAPSPARDALRRLLARREAKGG
ncbi:MAG TPA: DciA family protein [Burkholderiales bacterium]|nr:DciA family protein [Burkholderiales bacterium]